MKKKKTIASAVLLASTAGLAHAQSSVTIYGVIDVPSSMSTTWRRVRL